MCDKWIEPSIKDCEREDRGSLRGFYSIKGPTQIRPSDWGEALKNKPFKESLIGFLIEAWKDDSKNKTVYANYNNRCYKYCAENEVAISTEEDQFFSSHEEADNRIFFHLNRALPGSTVLM